MRAGLSTIQQTLTPEAASVLNHSIAEASRRNHGQTTPLHVAATLLASPTGYLRQACIKSHPNSSHPLQCRALELCFSVALERLPTAQQSSGPGIDPPISNALMAALKRAQAHQRRGCPEQQQQPLLAVKVELEQLIISILDDPSVSRVMREASFSSPAVKATIEQSLNSTASHSGPIGLGFRPVQPPGPSTNRNPYLNPRLQQTAAAQQSGQPRGEVVQKVIEILLGGRRKNVVLVGASEPERVVKELLWKIESKEISDGLLRNVEVIRLNIESGSDKDQILGKIKEFGALVESKTGKLESGGLIIDLGDLKWLVAQQPGFGVVGGLPPPQQVVPEGGKAAVAEMGRLVARFGGRVWLIGTATCETYLRCQIHHPSMENDWDLQAVPIASRTPLQGLFPRIGQNGLLGSSAESMASLRGLSMASGQQRCLTDNFDQSKKVSGLCPQCLQNYEQELTRMEACKELEKSSEKLDSAKSALPQWLQNAKIQDGATKTTDQLKDEVWKQKSSALQKWNDMCLHLHPRFHQTNPGSERFASNALSMTSLCAPNTLTSQTLQQQPPRLQQCRSVMDTLPMNPRLMNPVLMSSRPAERASTPPGSPVRTDLVLGRPKLTAPEPTPKELVRDFFSSGPQKKLQELPTGKLLDAADSFKKFLKSLVEKVWWQHDAASAVATTVAQCRLGNGRRRAAGSKGDIWLLFMGPDRAGKKKMASALSELVCGAHPVSISLGTRRNDEEPDPGVRGKTVVDRIAETVRRNPLSVIMLEDIDEADSLVKGSIKRAMERGRLADAHGREISLGNVIFILTTNWLPDNLKLTSHANVLDDKKLTSLASRGWQLRLSLSERSAKRRASWLRDEEDSSRMMKPRKETCLSGLSFDLNETVDVADDKGDGSHNSSDLTVDHEEERERCYCPTDDNKLLSSSSHDLLSSVDDAIAFKPVDFGPIKRELANAVTRRFSAIVGERVAIEIPDEALEKITSGVWIGQTGMEEWMEKVLVPSFHELKPRLGTVSDDSLVVRLEIEAESDDGCGGEWLPESIKVAVEGF